MKKYTFTIYGLYSSEDPTKEIRYVGKTKVPLSVRLRQHNKNHVSGSRGRWVKQLKDAGAIVLATVLEVVESDDENAWREPEARWVKLYQVMSPGLLNDFPGGYGVGDFSPASLARMSASQRGRKCSPETKLKQRLAKLGYKHRPESIAKMKLKKLSPEAREALRLVNVGKKMSPEWVEKMREITKRRFADIKLSPEEYRKRQNESCRRYYAKNKDKRKAKVAAYKFAYWRANKEKIRNHKREVAQRKRLAKLVPASTNLDDY